ncbi:MAG: metallophosphoesterase [Aureispira sp.]|nr:metallophosphoesterase [Aureispira sp.]
MKIVAISDTHGQHHKLDLPTGDVLIHAGDISKKGTLPQVKDFLHWFAQLDFQYKIFIAGNHDFYFEKAAVEDIQNLIPEGIIYLNDSGVEIEGIKIWGSPVQPWYHDWAFNRERGDEIKKHWDLIPDDIDILVTHGPVYGILDTTIRGERVGCKELLSVVQTIKPKTYICGHIHEHYGTHQTEDTLFINASILNLRYKVTHKPVVFEL